MTAQNQGGTLAELLPKSQPWVSRFWPETPELLTFFYFFTRVNQGNHSKTVISLWRRRLQKEVQTHPGAPGSLVGKWRVRNTDYRTTCQAARSRLNPIARASRRRTKGRSRE
jgi:hypothetical protein